MMTRSQSQSQGQVPGQGRDAGDSLQVQVKIEQCGVSGDDLLTASGGKFAGSEEAQNLVADRTSEAGAGAATGASAWQYEGHGSPVWCSV